MIDEVGVQGARTSVLKYNLARIGVVTPEVKQQAAIDLCGIFDVPIPIAGQILADVTVDQFGAKSRRSPIIACARIGPQFCPGWKGQTQGEAQLRPKRLVKKLVSIEDFLHIVLAIVRPNEAGLVTALEGADGLRDAYIFGDWKDAKRRLVGHTVTGQQLAPCLS